MCQDFWNQTVEEGEPVSFDATGSSDADGDTLSYLWDFGDGSTAAGAQPAHVYTDDGTYRVTLTVEDGFGAASTDWLDATVLNAPPEILSVTNDGPVVAGEPATVTVAATDVSGDPLTYELDFDNDGVFEISNTTGIATGVLPAEDVYPVNVRVSEGDG